MEMASSAANSTLSSATSRSANALPSLFGDHSVSGGVGSTTAGKDLDGLMAMNDSALSQQIEFILQDAPMEQDDEVVNGMVTENTIVTSNKIKLKNPPNNIITSASDYNHSAEGTTIVANTQSAQQLNQLHERRIIIQSRAVAAIKEEDDMEDPELNDENLQDIAEEAQAADEDEDPPHLHTHVKLERQDPNEMSSDNNMEYITTPTITTHHSALVSQAPQLVLPAGSIVSTSGRALSVPVSEALVQLQRRPVYISNSLGGVTGATFVRMPAVISRNPMTVLNVVQQGVPVGGPTTQLILQAAPVSNSTATSVVVNSSNSAIVAASSTNTSLPITETVVAAPSTAIVSASSTTAPLPSSSTTINNAPVSASPLSTSNVVVQASSTPTTAAASTTTTTYQCLECVEKFDSKELFDIHRSGHANNMKCAICNMVLKSLKNYEKHCLRCKPYECQICGRVVRFRPNFIKHMRVHTGQQSERHKYKCDVCHKEFMSFEYFKVHKKIHNENVNLTCEICGKVFSALASLRGHSKLHSGVKLHKCDVCGKGFGQRYNLKIHARTHTGDFPFECKICNKKLHTQSSLQTHMQVHQRDQTSQVTTTIKYEQSSSTTTSSGTSNTKTSTTPAIVKLEPQSSLDGPSTSGLQHQHHDDMDDNSGMSDGMHGTHIVTTTSTIKNSHLTTGDDSSNESNASHELQRHQQQQHQQQLLLSTPTRTIVFKNYMQNDPNISGITQQQTQVIQGVGSSSTLQQQLLRKTPIIHSTGGATTLSSALASVVQQTGISPSPSPSSSSTSCSSSVVVNKTLALGSVGIGTSTIRSTHNHNSNSISNNHRALQRNNHRNHHRHRHPADLDDDENDHDPNLHRATNGRHFDDDDDDEKSSPSLATTAIIKTEPNFYSSGSGDNSNDLLIKKEIMFEDSAAPQSPHSPPSSKYRISNFDSDLVDHHVDLTHVLPPYGNLFEPHSIPDSIPTQLYPDDDDDFRLDHSSLGALHNTSSSTNDGDFIKKEWAYGAGSSYTMNGKFDDDSDALCDAASFIYN
ncbi:uncharacterized protein LOC119670716 [Teleopsis dalmanni]|uniref:uncharacterized protein LOC119670716 n=1 Tax=Teleopsis dalmanni TaxID=139649 RepID=UPI0018CD046D|nr:uncharacterized protein LOC119670716 [Teleopsis dalmanni]